MLHTLTGMRLQTVNDWTPARLCLGVACIAGRFQIPKSESTPVLLMIRLVRVTVLVAGCVFKFQSDLIPLAVPNPVLVRTGISIERSQTGYCETNRSSPTPCA